MEYALQEREKEEGSQEQGLEKEPGQERESTKEAHSRA
jgi:hypothetical protein